MISRRPGGSERPDEDPHRACRSERPGWRPDWPDWPGGAWQPVPIRAPEGGCGVADALLWTPQIRRAGLVRAQPCLGKNAGLPGQKTTERVDVSEPASISAGIAGRYATAVFELVAETGGMKGLEADVEAMSAALADSSDLRALISSPLYSREDQGRAVAALAGAMGLSATFAGTLGLMAERRRLFVLPQLVKALRARIAEAKGEVTADVTAAAPLTAVQSRALADSLSKSVGKTVKLNVAVDEGLIGGLVVKVGSKMIDTSIRAKLASLQNAMKEVG